MYPYWYCEGYHSCYARCADYGYGYLRFVKRAEKCASCSFCTGNARSTDADQLLIPSATGQASATMPIMAQLADIIGVSRQTAVLAFQFGDGLSNIFWPTADIVIICGLGGISLQKWYKWFTPLFLILFVTQAILLGIATGIGF